MAYALNDLINDVRLTRLFSAEAYPCALQLWILQIKFGELIESRVVYGRLLPYSFSNSKWFSINEDNFQDCGEFQAQVVRLNLYVTSTYCEKILENLSLGFTLKQISEELNFALPEKLDKRFGATALKANDLAYRPVAYLINRDAHDLQSISSPHAAAGAFSAAITNINKDQLFSFCDEYSSSLTELLVKRLNEDTGLDFAGKDAARFGDLELLVFPTLDELEHPLLSVNWGDARRALIAQFNPAQVPYFHQFQFRLCITNGGQIIYSKIATAKRDAQNVFGYVFNIDGLVSEITDSAELEVFGAQDDNSDESTLCCRWRMNFIREISTQIHVVGNQSNPVKFDWLEKTTRPSLSQRVQTALTIKRSNTGIDSNVGGRKADPWVSTNRKLSTLFARLYPPKSEGQFFLRWGQGDGEGRLQFVEWLKALFAKYQQNQIIIFDPFFDKVGLRLVLLCGVAKADYIVITSLAKITKTKEIQCNKPDQANTNLVNDLVVSCKRNHKLLDSFRLRLYGLKEKYLHDRYILVVGSDGLPIAGYNLSNSLQGASQDHPLLITPIPADALLKVEQYKAELLKKAVFARNDDEPQGINAMQLLFDSRELTTPPRRYEPLSFLSKHKSGDAFSTWTGEPTLIGLCGAQLIEKMTELGLIQDGSLRLPETSTLSACLHNHGDDYVNFAALWEVLGEVLANTSAGDSYRNELKFEENFLDFLAKFLNASFDRSIEDLDSDFTMLEARLFQEPLEALLQSSYQAHHFCGRNKYAALTWAEFFAIRFLWWYAPNALLSIAEIQMTKVSMDVQSLDVMRPSLLSQIVNQIAFSVEFDISEMQRARLLRSSTGLLQWLGLLVIEKELEKPSGIAIARQLLSAFTDFEQIRFLGWLVNRSARKSTDSEIYKDLVTSLHKALPATITATELRHLVDAMRGHMRQLAWTEPWLFQDVVEPLLQSNRVRYEDVCEIWMQELAGMLSPHSKSHSRLFDKVREGQITSIAAYLYAHSSAEQQTISLRLIQAILMKQKRIVQQPLASTSEWSLWNDALQISMWILVLAKWMEYYSCERNATDLSVDQLTRDASGIAMIRAMSEWRDMDASRHGGLAESLDDVNQLIAAQGNNKSTNAGV